jgi:hypothetical protein
MAFRSKAADAPTEANAREQVRTFSSLPLGFVPNEGQADAGVRFLGYGPGYRVSLTDTEAILTLLLPEAPSDAVPRNTAARRQGLQETTLRIRLAPAAPGRIMPIDKLPGVANYYVGNDPRRWRRGIPTFARVRYEDLYPGIDLLFYGNPSQLDFLVDPGVDPSVITLAFDGTDPLELDSDGNLVTQTAGGRIVLSRPVVYQEREGERQPVSGDYALLGNLQAAFRLGAYDRSRRLTIDPSAESEADQMIDVTPGGRVTTAVILPASQRVFTTDGDADSDGNIYGVGFTAADDFPTAMPYQPMRAGVEDWVVWSVDPDGPALRWSTYLGGNASDRASGLVLGADGSTYVVGSTQSVDFPTAGTPAQPQIGSIGLNDAAVVRLGPTGELLAGTFVGGSADDLGNDIDVDPTGNVLITGSTTGSFPVTPDAFQSTFGGLIDAFVARLDASLGAIVHSTFLGGSGVDVGHAIAAGSMSVAGQTFSPNFPLLNPEQETYGGNGDGFVTRLDQNGSLVFSTYVGGAQADILNAIVVSQAANQVIAGGQTFSGAPFPRDGVVPAADPNNADGLLARFSFDGTLMFSAGVGGSGNDSIQALALERGTGRHSAIGSTTSTGFPTTSNAIGNSLGSTGLGIFNPQFTPIADLSQDFFQFRGFQAIGSGNFDGFGPADLGLLEERDGFEIPQIILTFDASTSDGQVVVIAATGASDITVDPGSTGDDIIVSTGGGAYRFTNTGNGTFAPATPVPGTEGIAVSRILFNGPQYVVSPRDVNEVRFFSNGILRQLIPIDSPALDIVTGDLDGDSRADLAIGQPGRILTHRYDANLDLFIPDQTVAIPSGNFRLVADDFDGDGRAEVIANFEASGFGRLFLNVNGVLQPSPQSLGTGRSSTRIVTGDYNADGMLDFATPNGAGQTTFFSTKAHSSHHPSPDSTAARVRVRSPLRYRSPTDRHGSSWRTHSPAARRSRCTTLSAASSTRRTSR